MQKVNNLQDIFLTKARQESVPVTLFLVNGFQLRGIITGFDCCVGAVSYTHLPEGTEPPQL